MAALVQTMPRYVVTPSVRLSSPARSDEPLSRDPASWTSPQRSELADRRPVEWGGRWRRGADGWTCRGPRAGELRDMRARVGGDPQAERDGWSARARNTRRSGTGRRRCRSRRSMPRSRLPAVSGNRPRRLHRLRRGHTPGNASTTQPEPLDGYVDDTETRLEICADPGAPGRPAPRCPKRASAIAHFDTRVPGRRRSAGVGYPRRSGSVSENGTPITFRPTPSRRHRSVVHRLQQLAPPSLTVDVSAPP